MYSTNKQSTPSEFHKRQQHYQTENIYNSLEYSNYNGSVGQKHSFSLTTSINPFSKTPINTLAEIYYKKYGNLCNQIPIANFRPFRYYEPKSHAMEVFQGTSKHITRRFSSPQRNFFLPKPNALILHRDKFIPKSLYDQSLKLLYRSIELEKVAKSSKPSTNPTADILLMEKIPAIILKKGENNISVDIQKAQTILKKEPSIIYILSKDRRKGDEMSQRKINEIDKNLIDNSKIIHPEGHNGYDKNNISSTVKKDQIILNTVDARKNLQQTENKDYKTENDDTDAFNVSSKVASISHNTQNVKRAQGGQNIKKKFNEKNDKSKNGVKTPHQEDRNVQKMSQYLPKNEQRKLNNQNKNINKNEKSKKNANAIKLEQPQSSQSNAPTKIKQNQKNAPNNKNAVDIKTNAPTTTNESANTNKDIQHRDTKDGGDNVENQITEIFKCGDTTKFYGSVDNLSKSASLQKVTQDLARIIKNLQKQIQQVPNNKPNKVDEIPSALIQTKNKQFFKRPNNVNQKGKSSLNSTKASGSLQSKSIPNSKQNSFLSVRTNSSKVTSYNSLKSSSHSRTSSTSSITSNRKPIQSKLSNTSSKAVIKKTSLQNVDTLKVLKEEVQKAIRGHKTFTVRGHFHSIRKALRSRGWVERFDSTFKDHLNSELKRYVNYTINDLVPLTKKQEVAELCKNLIKSKLLGSYQVDFYWGTNYEAFRLNPDKIKLTIINKLKRDIFSYTNKQGLCDASKQSHWYQKEDFSKLNHPRSYSLAAKCGDVKCFVEDFRNTAAMSLLKWILKVDGTKESKLISPSGKIPLEVFDFAMNECGKFIKKRKHEDIDVNIPEASEQEWNTFLDYFYRIVHYCNHFKEEKKETEKSLVNKATYVINTLKEVWPWIDMDGMMNIWILKPVASSRGRGIHMCRTLQYVLKVIKENSNIRYIIQKYIERPLLIHNTKFDIRQWFLISNCSPLTIWMFKECYLRFSSQTYNLRKLHESIHLTNNSVQCKYKNNSIDAAIPSYNMWTSKEFTDYLTNIGYPTVFKNTIYPGMKQSIIAAVLMHQDKMIARKNCFELYGADFILTEDYQPWLLEINSNPALYASTPVTSRMCPQVLEDVVKVIIDYARNYKANTGGFEMIYKEKILKLPETASLQVQGKPLKREYFNTAPEEKEQSSMLKMKKPIALNTNQDNIYTFTNEIKTTLKNLLEIIHEEKRKREGKEKNNENLVSQHSTIENQQIKT